MHKISPNVHKSSKLCNYYLVISSICTIFELKLEARLHLENKNKSRFILYFARFALSLHLTIKT